MNRHLKYEQRRIWRFLGSLALAFLVWYAINGSSNDIVTRYITDIPVTFTNEDVLNEKNLSIQQDQTYFVNLEVRGTEDNLDSINTNELAAEIDLSRIERAGEQDVEVIVKGLNNSVILEETVPGNIRLDVNAFTNQSKTPEIITEGKPADNYIVITASTTEQVSLSGADTDIARVSQVSGIASVNGMTQDSTQLVHVYAYDEAGNQVQNVSCNPDMVTAQITVGISKEVLINPPKVNGTIKEGFKITDVSVIPDKINIAGKPEQVNGINSLNVEQITVPQNNDNRSFSVDSELIVPENVDVLNSDYSVQVKVNIEQIIERTYTVSSLETVNLANNLEVTKIDPGSVVIRVSGTAAELQKVDASSLKGQIDLKGLGVGDHVVAVTVTQENTNILSITPEKVQVNIAEKKQK